MTLLSPDEATRLLDRVIYEEVCRAVKFDALANLERRIAVELGRLEASDARMLAVARGMISRAVRQIADATEHGVYSDESMLSVRYENAICREIDESLAQVA